MDRPLLGDLLRGVRAGVTVLALALVMLLALPLVARAAVIFTDDFNRADSDDPGAAWGGSSSQFRIVGNEFGRKASSYACETSDAEVAVHGAQVERVTATGEAWLTAGGTTAGEQPYWRLGVSGGVYVLQEVDSNSLNETQTSSVSSSAGDLLRIEVESAGVSAYVNGSAVASSGSPGHGSLAGVCADNTATRFDNFATDDLDGEDPPPPDPDPPAEDAWTAGNVRAVGLALALLVFLGGAGLTRDFARGSKAA